MPLLAQNLGPLVVCSDRFLVGFQIVSSRAPAKWRRPVHGLFLQHALIWLLSNNAISYALETKPLKVSVVK